MSEQSKPSKFIPFECPQCRYLNNLMKASRCEQCGLLFRRTANEPAKRARKGGEIVVPPIKAPEQSSWLVKTAISVAVVAIVAVSGLVVVERRGPVKAPPVLGEAKLSETSWYKPSLFNFMRPWPTREEIIARGIDSTSATLRATDVKTLELGGALTVVADVTHDVDVAMDEEFRTGKPSPGAVRPAADARGRIELKADGNKIFRRLTVGLSGAGKRLETIDVFDGANASRIRLTFDGDRETDRTPETIDGPDLDNLKRFSFLTDRTDSAPDFVFDHIVASGDKVRYGLRDARPDHDLTYFFDSETGLPASVEGENMKCFLARYAETSGLSLPTEMRCRFLTSRSRIDWLLVTNIVWKVNQAPDPSVFKIN